MCHAPGGRTEDGGKMWCVCVCACARVCVCGVRREWYLGGVMTGVVLLCVGGVHQEGVVMGYRLQSP